jgi:hypothetical protein
MQHGNIVELKEAYVWVNMQEGIIVLASVFGIPTLSFPEPYNNNGHTQRENPAAPYQRVYYPERQAHRSSPSATARKPAENLAGS